MDELLLEAMYLVDSYPELSDFELGQKLYENEVPYSPRQAHLGVFVDFAKEVRKIGIEIPVGFFVA